MISAQSHTHTHGTEARTDRTRQRQRRPRALACQIRSGSSPCDVQGRDRSSFTDRRVRAGTELHWRRQAHPRTPSSTRHSTAPRHLADLSFADRSRIRKHGGRSLQLLLHLQIHHHRCVPDGVVVRYILSCLTLCVFDHDSR